jgi:hypothetical protein
MGQHGPHMRGIITKVVGAQEQGIPSGMEGT